MPSPTDFNVSPYYDDFSEDKKFHRVLYRPGFAVQARELTSQQTILQNQIEKFGEHMFEQGAMVIPGNVTVDIHYQAVKLTSFTGTLNNFVGATITGGTSGVKGKVVKVSATDGTDPDTLFVKYRDSGTSNEGAVFTDGETITSAAATAETAVVDTTATGSAAHISAGTYFINGFFVEVTDQSILLDKYTNQPSYRIGLTITENFITSTDDTSLLDNASGSSNENATGAHRFKIELTLEKLSLTSTADSSFVEVARVRQGVLEEKVTSTAYNIMEDTLARRTFDESGDYAVRAFDLDVREHLISGTNRGIYATDATSADGNTADEAKLALGLSQGKAYVRGYEIEKHGTTYIDLDKAREFETQSGSTTRFEQLPFVNTTSLSNLPDVGFVSGATEAYKTLRLVDTQHSSRGSVLTSSGGTNFDIGRAKTRAIEFNSGSASTVFLSNSSVTTNTFKHYLFDIEMFAHVNVVGAASGSFTNGEIVTGGTSGATGIFQSVSTKESSTITGATSANPVVVTCSGGHKLKEGQQVTISGVSGITDINATWTVKDPTATTFKLFAASSASVGDASGTQPATVNGTGYSSYSGSGGLAKHDVVILSNVDGEFVDGETITGATSSVTATVQHSAYNQKGFSQKKFPQTKGISMAGSPVFTSDVDLTSTFGSQKTLTGTVSIANSVTALKGFGTRFQSELVIGDVIEFTDDANTTVTKIVESIESDTALELSAAVGGSDVTTKASFIRKRTKMQETETDRALFKMPYKVVKTLLTADNNSISDTSFKIRRQFVKTLGSDGTETLTAGTNETFTAHSDTDFLATITATGSGGTGAVGDVLTLSSSGDYTLAGSPTGKTVNLDLGSGFNGHTLKIVATLSTSVVSAKTKTANTAETTTVNTQALATADFISLGKADVYSIDSVHMAADFSTAADTSDTDITNRFDLDTGQRDNFYDIARLVRKPGTQDPTGRLLITFNFFSHGAGNFFSVDSYSGTDYGNIPTYTSDVTGKIFPLRDCLDFRPRVDDASTIDSGTVDRSFDGTGASTVDVMKINSDVTADLEYYLSRRDKIFLTADGDFKAIKGASSLDPIDPEGIQDAMLLYKLFTPAYTFKTSDVEITPLDNRRFTMRDIGRLEKRIENVEYYTQLSLLESEAQNMQIQDSDGFDRFKNGIIVDNFTGHGVGDVSDNDYSISMDMGNGELRPAFHQDNTALVEVDSGLSETVTAAERAALGYQKTGDLITLPYSESTFHEQPFASNTVNLQPYNVIDFIGTITLDPEIDEWFETERQPDLQITMPGTFDTLTDLASAGVLDLNLGTVWGNWNDTWSGQVRESNRQVSTSGNVQTTTITTEQRVGQRRSGVRTSLIPNTVRTSFGDRVVSVGFAAFIREKSISFTAQDLKPNTRMYPFFDGIDISTYVTPTGSSAGAALTTDSKGECSGIFAIPDPKDTNNPRWRTGKRVFRLTTSSTNNLVNEIFSSAEADYTAKGLLNNIQQTIVSTREAQVQREDLQENTTITRTNRRNESVTLSPPRHEHNRNPDPVAQSFTVNSKDGLFLASIEAFFSTKDSSQPVQCQLRTMENGYPTTTILPFGISIVNGSSVSTSTDGTSATKFTFPSPVYLKDKTEYCFVLKSNSDEYTAWTARMGSKTVDSSRLISKQPVFGSMFKSQNGGTWTPEQNEDVKFKLNRCEFTTGTAGTLRLANADLPVKTLTKTNPLTTTASSGVVTVHHKNHGMHSTSNNVTIAGLASGSHNGIAHSNINGTYTTIGNIKLDSYTITAQSSDTASISGDVGSTTITATRNMLYDVIQPVIGNLLPPGCGLTATMRPTTGKTLEGTETEFTLSGASKAISINLNEDYYMTAPGMVASTINSTNEMSGSKSLVFTLTLTSAGNNTAISPVIDTKRMSAFLIQNRLFSPAQGTTPNFVAETKNSGGSVPAKYITKPVILKDEATSLDIRISANLRSTADFKVFFRTTSSEDVRKLNEKNYTAFNTDGSPDSSVAPAEDRETFKEYKFSASSLPEFTAFQLKVVLTGTNSSYPPLLKDLRGIALAI